MNGLKGLMIVFVMAALMLGTAGCAGIMGDEDGSGGEGAMEETGEAVGSAGEEIQETAEEAGEAMGEAAETTVEVVKPQPKVVLRVNAGAIQEYTDEAGNVWQADQVLAADKEWGALFGSAVGRGEIDIKGDTKAPGVYRSERFDMANYTFSVEPGTYNVKLHFAETFDGITSGGERVFDIKVNGEMELEDIDPYKMGGGLNAPVVKTVEGVSPNEDGKIIVEFVRKVQNPMVNGIQIIKTD